MITLNDVKVKERKLKSQIGQKLWNTSTYINKDSESIKEGIKIWAKESLVHCELKQHWQPFEEKCSKF
jgi:hypothetical protein